MTAKFETRDCVRNSSRDERKIQNCSLVISVENMLRMHKKKGMIVDYFSQWGVSWSSKQVSMAQRSSYSIL